MTSFEDFWKEAKNSPESSSLSVPELSTALATGIQGTLLPILGLELGLNNTQAEADKFSQEVSNYVTSEEVIHSISESIGEPKVDETEEEFVERAERTLREMLEKRFKI